MTDPNDPWMGHVNEVAAAGKAEYGDSWDAAIRGVARKMAAGEMTQADLAQMIARPNARDAIFTKGMESNLDFATAGDRAANSDYEGWRNTGPNRKARIDRTR